MKEVEYWEKPEVLEETIHSFLQNLKKYDQFHGVFYQGKIDGLYFSTRWLDMRRIFSLVTLKGSFNSNQGTIKFKISRSNYFFVIHLLLIVFGIGMSGMILNNNQIPELVILFPIGLVIINFFLYHNAYMAREKEITSLFKHYIEVSIIKCSSI